VTELPNSLALAYVSVGSNIEPEQNIEAALGLLMNRVSVTAVSMFYRTEPIGRPEQDPYLNGVFEILTDLPVREVTPLILNPIETQIGRVRSKDRFASRTLDLDLILYNDVSLCTPQFRLPHPDIERAFVLGPVLELLTRKALVHPCQQSMLDLLTSQQVPKTIGMPMMAFSRRLNVKSGQE
jgi:2-amino-4-hydroxy-6-hydroxymethyldihydropteridine diphosphokinase